jgi:anti-sigma factor RsiW
MNEAMEHLTDETTSAYVDGELAVGEQERIRKHLYLCAACSLRALSLTQLKAATARAGSRFQPDPAVLSRLEAAVRREPVSQGPRAWWIGLAAAALLAVSMLGWLQMRQANPLAAELLDQHLGSLSPAALPQVVSSDRHTVKPWFQGRLPFSFNLPEPQALPAEAVLRGADLTYLAGKPAALLLFTIRKHQVSVFVFQRGAGPNPVSLPNARSGFALRTATTQDLELIAVSDVSPPDLEALLASLVRVQS